MAHLAWTSVKGNTVTSLKQRDAGVQGQLWAQPGLACEVIKDPRAGLGPVAFCSHQLIAISAFDSTLTSGAHSSPKASGLSYRFWLHGLD